MTDTTRTHVTPVAEAQSPLVHPVFLGKMLVVAALVAIIYRRPFREIYVYWTVCDSLYFHGFRIALISPLCVSGGITLGGVPCKF